MELRSLAVDMESPSWVWRILGKHGAVAPGKIEFLHGQMRLSEVLNHRVA
jgi:hypothetical protein